MLQINMELCQTFQYSNREVQWENKQKTCFFRQVNMKELYVKIDDRSSALLRPVFLSQDMVVKNNSSVAVYKIQYIIDMVIITCLLIVLLLLVCGILVIQSHPTLTIRDCCIGNLCCVAQEVLWRTRGDGMLTYLLLWLPLIKEKIPPIAQL